MKKINALISLFLVAITITCNAQNETAKDSTTTAPAIDLAENLKGNLQVFSDGKYIAAKVDPQITHYVVYYTASW